MTNDNLAAEPDAFAQIKDLADDIAVLDKDMDDLVRATSATLRAMRR
jgi:dGTP triphosphohydrolase